MSDQIAPEMTDNQALREILGQISVLESILRQRYTAVAEVTALVTDGDPYERVANPDSVKTLITNTGADNTVGIYEGGALVKMLGPGETWVSPLDGSGAITVTAADALDSTISVTTYTKTT